GPVPRRELPRGRGEALRLPAADIRCELFFDRRLWRPHRASVARLPRAGRLARGPMREPAGRSALQSLLRRGAVAAVRLDRIVRVVAIPQLLKGHHIDAGVRRCVLALVIEMHPVDGAQPCEAVGLERGAPLRSLADVEREARLVIALARQGRELDTAALARG